MQLGLNRVGLRPGSKNRDIDTQQQILQRILTSGRVDIDLPVGRWQRCHIAASHAACVVARVSYESLYQNRVIVLWKRAGKETYTCQLDIILGPAMQKDGERDIIVDG